MSKRKLEEKGKLEEKEKGEIVAPPNFWTSC